MIIPFEDYVRLVPEALTQQAEQAGKPVPPLLTEDLRSLYKEFCYFGKVMDEALSGFIEDYCSSHGYQKYLRLSVKEQGELTFQLMKRANLSREDLLRIFGGLFAIHEKIFAPGEEPKFSDPEVVAGIVDSYKRVGVL